MLDNDTFFIELYQAWFPDLQLTFMQPFLHDLNFFDKAVSH